MKTLFRLVLFLIISEYSLAQVPDNKPNVLFIICDDLRAQLGCYGYADIQTPNLDNFAKDAIIFENVFAQQAICGPSRTSFLTGMRPDQTKVYSNRDHFRGINPNIVTLPQFFKQNGYSTYSFGKVFHNQILDDLPSWSEPAIDFQAPEYGPNNQAILDSLNNILKKRGVFQKRHLEYHPQTHQPMKEVRHGETSSWISWEAANVEDDYLVDGKIANEVIKKIQDYSAGSVTPFFFAVGLRKPHLPYVAPQKYFEHYPIENIELSKYKAPEEAPKYAFHNYDELREYVDIPDKDDIDTTVQKQLIRAYFACISYSDAQIGKILQSLKQQGLYDKTTIVVIGDHGYHLGELNIWTKQTNFDWATRAPMLIKPAKKIRGAKKQSMVEFVDIYPTLCQLSGLPIPKNIAGKSFASLILENKVKHKKYAFSQFSRKSGNVMGYSIRSKNLRYTEWVNTITGEVLGKEFYDYKESQIEIKNVVNENHYKKKISHLRKKLRKFRKSK